MRPSTPGIVAIAIAVGIVGCTVGPVAGDPVASPPTEIEQLRLVIEPTTPDARITAADAIEVANKEYSFDRSADSIKATLMTVTDPASREILDKRAVWAVFYSGLDVTGPSLPNADGTMTEGRQFSGAFVFVDADTGEFVMTAYTE